MLQKYMQLITYFKKYLKKKLLLIYTVISFSFVTLEIFMTEFLNEFGTCQQMSTTEEKKFQLICSQCIARSALSKKLLGEKGNKQNICIFEGHFSWLFSIHKEN